MDREISSWIAKTSSSWRSKCPDQSGTSSATRTSRAFMRTRWPSRRTDPSTISPAWSAVPTSCVLRGLFLKVNDEVSERTSSPSITDRLRMISSVRPSTKYSLSGSGLRFLNGSTAMTGGGSCRHSVSDRAATVETTMRPMAASPYVSGRRLNHPRGAAR